MTQELPLQDPFTNAVSSSAVRIHTLRRAHSNRRQILAPRYGYA
jgi:hypothetical protein